MAIKSLEGFIKTFKKFQKNDNYEYFYRGHSDFRYQLLPSIYREKCLIVSEDKIFREIIIRTPHEFTSQKNTMEQLVKMQHYGLPTRLLDVTTNPLVALFFSCLKQVIDGEVLILRIPKSEVKFFDSDTVSVISNISKMSIDFSIGSTNKENIDLFNATMPIPLLIHQIRNEKYQFQPIINPIDLFKVLAVRVKLDNERIIKQNGAFLLYGINKKKEEPAKIPKSWILNSTFNHFDFRISNEHKLKILKDLDVMGINESTMFPDLPNQTKYVTDIFKQNSKSLSQKN